MSRYRPEHSRPRSPNGPRSFTVTFGLTYGLLAALYAPWLWSLALLLLAYLAVMAVLWAATHAALVRRHPSRPPVPEPLSHVQLLPVADSTAS